MEISSGTMINLLSLLMVMCLQCIEIISGAYAGLAYQQILRVWLNYCWRGSGGLVLSRQTDAA
jgi:hypothetical protein